jgi:uncharacterized protein
MPTFTLHCLKPDGQHVRVLYDNMAHSLTWEDGVPVIAGEPKNGTSKPRLKISLGFNCNYHCQYCQQGAVIKEQGLVTIGAKPKQNFSHIVDIAKSKEWGEIAFWGGEPLLYWETLKPLAEAIRAALPDASFMMITNGTLLTPEINEWLDRMDFMVGISHDGPGQKYRGADPLEHPKRSSAIHDLYRRLHPKERIAFNPMLHRWNHSRKAINDFFVERFGDDVRIGEGEHLMLYEPRFGFTTEDEWRLWRLLSWAEIRSGAASNMSVVGRYIRRFLDGLNCGQKHPPTNCQTEGSLSIDLNGNEMACHNCAEGTLTYWPERSKCRSCPMLHLCRGGCPLMQGDVFERTCTAYYSDYVPFFCAAIEMVCGCVPYRINERDLF